MLDDRAVGLSAAKVNVFSDSVLCLGQIAKYPRSATSWKGKIEWLDTNGYLLHVRAIQGHPGGNKVDPSLKDIVLIPCNWIEYIYHVGSSHDCHSRIKSCLIAGGNDAKKGRQTGSLHRRGSHERTTRG